jgi:hypothetical protein
VHDTSADPRFTLQPLDSVGLLDQGRGNHFHDHVPAHAWLTGEVDLTEGATAEQRQDEELSVVEPCTFRKSQRDAPRLMLSGGGSLGSGFERPERSAPRS